jgi:hypothetical protein
VIALNDEVLVPLLQNDKDKSHADGPFEDSAAELDFLWRMICDKPLQRGLKLPSRICETSALSITAVSCQMDHDGLKELPRLTSSVASLRKYLGGILSLAFVHALVVAQSCDVRGDGIVGLELATTVAVDPCEPSLHDRCVLHSLEYEGGVQCVPVHDASKMSGCCLSRRAVQRQQQRRDATNADLQIQAVSYTQALVVLLASITKVVVQLWQPSRARLTTMLSSMLGLATCCAAATRARYFLIAFVARSAIDHCLRIVSRHLQTRAADKYVALVPIPLPRSCIIIIETMCWPRGQA